MEVIAYDQVLNVLGTMFPNEEDFFNYASDLVNFIHAEFGDAVEFGTTVTDGGDLRVRITNRLRNSGIFGISRYFGITVYLPDGEQNDTRLRVEPSCQKMSGATALELIENGDIDIIKNYIRLSYQRRIENQQQNPQIQTTTIVNTLKDESKMLPLNTILYGAPGTGKTFSVVDYAYAITNKCKLNQDAEGRKDRKKDFDEKVGSQISFVTFHQSFSYEEFVEGIRAKTTEEGQINYSVENGIFKEMCLRAQKKLDSVNDNPKIWKVSIESTNDNPTKTYCFQNNEIRIGWGHTGDLNDDVDLNNADLGLSARNKGCLLDFSKHVQIGDIVVCSSPNSRISAVGVIKSSYKYDSATADKGIRDDYKHVREVEWIFKNINFDIRTLNKQFELTQLTIYELSRIKWIKLVNSLKKEGHTLPSDKPHVLIIDEINRGNISKIFGELITLIEESKRDGNDEKLTVTLPYSKEPFSVPNNLYIIGTMNTADRSLALMDTALRRRFDFIEMMPKPEFLEDIEVEGVNIERMLTTMNKRITVLYDREHTLGHAFFMSLTSKSTIDDLANIFQNKIIPLLQEYFFEDWEKIRKVLGNNEFIISESADDLGLGEEFEEMLNLYSFNQNALMIPAAYQKIYG